MILHLPPALAAQIEREAREAAPRECCGLIEGAHIDGVFKAAALHPARNIAEAADRFEIDPADHFRALHAARANERQIIGCYHSHPGRGGGAVGRTTAPARRRTASSG